MWARWSATYRPVCEALAVGLLLGFVDCNHAGDGGFTVSAYFIGGAMLGLRHAGRSRSCWLPLGFSLYFVHVIAVACGRQPPYVEENVRLAEQCLLAIFPAGLGIMAGSGICVGLSSKGWFHRESGPPLRFLPRTTREFMVAVACVGICLGILHRVEYPPTIYAAGYDEARFHAIREGMTATQVMTALGSPLRKQTFPDGDEEWVFSDQYTYLYDYERRLVMFKGSLVRQVFSDHWTD